MSTLIRKPVGGLLLWFLDSQNLGPRLQSSSASELHIYKAGTTATTTQPRSARATLSPI